VEGVILSQRPTIAREYSSLKVFNGHEFVQAVVNQCNLPNSLEYHHIGVLHFVKERYCAGGSKYCRHALL
jgi:hypothetical protein